eukprot:gene21459-27796_t
MSGYDSSISIEIASQLLNETVEIAQEEGVTGNCLDFSQYILDMIPTHIIDQLRDIYGGDDFIQEIWNERFSISSSAELIDEIFLENGCCSVCERKVRLTRHHLYPRETHRRKLKEGISETELKSTVAICRMCHSTIHRFFTNDVLADEYFTIDQLLSDEKFYRYAKWASTQSDKRNGKVK